MNALDLVFLVILVLAGYRGYQTGFLISLISILAFVIATISAFALLHWGVQVLDEWIVGFSEVLPYLAFILIFAGVVILINIIGKILKKVIDLTLLGSFDNVGGGIIGVLKWVFGLSLLIWLVDYLGLTVPEDWLQGSVMYAKLEPVAPFIFESCGQYLPFLSSIFESITEGMRSPIQ